MTSNQPNTRLVCHKYSYLFACLLLLALSCQSLSSASSVDIPTFSNNDQALNANSRYEYTVDTPSPIREMTPQQQRGQGNNMPVTAGATNLTALTWAHAVNSQRELNDALKSNIDMIEADIVMGKINATGPDMPVMAHPPQNTSDISLEAFLLQIKEHNDAHAEKMIGVKLDFKSIEVFEGALETLKEKIPMMTYPIWLNADIISGPVNQTTTVPVDPERFFAGCSQFPKAVLSIGWTTRWSSEYSNGCYAPDHTESMLAAIVNNNVSDRRQAITFPVRAGIAANSENELHNLVRAVNDTNDSTLTIWSSPNDYVDVTKLRQLIFSFGFDRVYLDVPEELASKLDLSRHPDDETEPDDDGGGKGGSGQRNTTVASLVNFSLMSAGLYLFSVYLKKIRI